MKHIKMNTSKAMKRVVSIATSMTLLISSLYYPELGEEVSEVINTITASATVNGFKEIDSLEELYRFSAAYSSDSSFQYRDIQININGDIEISPVKDFDGVPLEWHPIGTSGRPFGGRITLSTTAGMTQNIVVNSPLFGYVMDSVEIVNINDYKTQKINLIKNDSSDAPLFATNVVHDSTSTPTTWKISTEGAGAHSGIVGTVGTGADQTTVNLELEVNSSAEVSTVNNAGHICGTINKDSKVNVDFLATSTASAANITSSNGNAGGLVGEMFPGSELNIITNGTTYANTSRTVTGKTYAGGLVGKNDQGTVTIKVTESSAAEDVYNALGTIKATDGAAGGVFGYYKITDTYNKFSPDYYTSTTGCSLNGKTAGGLVGVLEASGIDVSYSGADSDNKLTVISSLAANNTNYGGIVGTYSNTDLTKSFTVEHVNVTTSGGSSTNYGGTIASLTGNSAVYVKVNDFSCTSNSGASGCSYFGGAVGDSGSRGSLLDIGDITVVVKKNNALDTFTGGGVVGKHNSGVLRLSGTTDLSQATAGSKGQIVGERTNGLVYALGSGEDEDGTTYEGGWRLIRSSTDANVDDIGTWGEVVRIADVEVKDPEESADISDAILIYNSTAHTVTVGSAVTDMRNSADFTRTALNMQLNDGDDGSLIFTSSERTELLDDDYTIFGTISLSGTGITGFMRDGSTKSGNDTSEIKFFTGSLSKGEAADGEEDADAVVELAVGERYGILPDVDGTVVSDSNSTGRGAIFKHRFNGLFARTGEGAVIEDISIDGTMNINADAADLMIGGAIAYLCNGASLTDVNVSETINYKNVSGDGHYVGGLIGKTECAAGKNVTIGGEDEDTKATVSPTINVTGTLRSNIKDSDKTVVYQTIGGLIGYISSTAAAKTTVEHMTLSANVDASGTTAAGNVSTAGLIADIAWNSTDTRSLVLNDIDVEDTLVKNTATNETGGILGYRWLGTDVTFDDVVLTSGNEIVSPASYVGGLVYRATGHWIINSAGIDIDDLAIKKNADDTATPTGLGIILHDGYNSTSGVYMEFMAEDSFDLASGLSSMPDMTGSGKIYDELCACLAKDAASILTNDTAGVISYYTSGGEYTSADGTKNSYNNVYNQAVVNNRSRYYYNADSESYTTNSEDDAGYELLYWSLNRYAAANIKRCFTNPFSTDSGDVLTGTFDLEHISYYPIDISKKVTIGESDFIFYNEDIETAEVGTNTKRSTRSNASQHYLMHMGLFRNVTNTITTTGNITMYGTVGVDGTYSGALINGSLTGTLNTDSNSLIQLGYYTKRPKKVEIPLELSGSNIDERFMLINSIGDNADVNLNGITVDPDCGYDTSNNQVYASSLIGDVRGVGITLRFNSITIDSRNKEDVATGMDDSYGTTKSIFKNATLLNSYDVDSTSVAIYNFSQSEDWENARSYLGYVTYGKELTDSVEYRLNGESEENRYYEDGDNGHYIDPEEYPGDYPSSGTVPENSAYDFSDNFLPYVRYYNISEAPEGYTPEHTLREIKVNVVPSDLSTGCGTYDHPYVITSSKQLITLAAMLDNSTNNNDNFGQIVLPLKANLGSHWCISGETHTCNTFTHANGTYTSTTTTEEWAKNEVKAYLSSAYYQIGQDIVLGTSFSGLGAYNSDYAFKGVIVGLNNNITITNRLGVPFIKMSNGSVVKNLKIVVDNKDGNNHKTVLTAGSDKGTTTKFSYSNNTMVYGGLIGTIMGGDNIIDNVSMTYNNGGYIQIPSANSYLDCVGGYVGVIVNGGLVFRNMNASNFTNKASFKVNTSLNNANSTNWVSSTDNSHLYINPYIGRVINGYAINETTGENATYSGNPVVVKDASDNDVYKYYDENGNELTDVADPEKDNRVVKSVQQFKYVSILDNSTKNYQIADVVSDIDDTTSEKLNYDTFANKNRVNIPTGQSLFILSLITQTGAGTATTADGEYVYGVAYDCTSDTNRYDSGTTGSAAKNTATHLAQYNHVGSAAVSADYTLSTNDTVNSATAVPYIIHHYTKADSNGKFPARMMTGNTEFMWLSTEDGTYNLPVSFRGIGSICRFKGGDKTSIDIYKDQQSYNNYIGRYVDANRLQYNWEQAGVNGTVDEDGKFSMKIYGFEGNGSTININLNYNIYADNQNNGTIADNYNNTIYTNGNINVAFGLFNYVKQKSNATTTLYNDLYSKGYNRPETSNIPNYNLTSGYYIGNFTLSGNVVVHEYNDKGVLQGESSKREQKDQTMYRHSVGGVIGATTVNDYVNFFKLDLVDMNVEGAANVGGYIGRNNVTERNVDYGNGMNYIYANACDTDNLTVKSGGGYCGGFIAGGLSGYLDLFVNTAQNSNTSDTAHRGGDGYYKSTMKMSVSNSTGTAEWGTGGVLGSLRNGYLVNIWINNVTVSGANKSSEIKNSSTAEQDTTGVGGLIGFVRKADTIILTNCSVEDINIAGPASGGLTGCISVDVNFPNFGSPPVMKVYNCKVVDNDEDTSFGITGVRQAGGLCGNFQSDQSYATAENARGYDYDSTKNNVYRYDIDGCEVNGYTIKVTSNQDKSLGSGGIIGYAAQATRTIVNTSVHDCSIMIEGSKANHGMGGVVGNTAIAVWGYNIAAYNNSFSYVGSSTSARYGGFVGNPNSKVLKIAGFTRKNNNLVTASATTAITADAGSATGTGSYVIDADYMNTSISDLHGTSMAVGFDNGTNVSEGGRKHYFPYVTVSPKTPVGEDNFLTGDGVSIVDIEKTVKVEGGEDETVTASVPVAKLITDENTGTAADNRIAYKTVSDADITTVKNLISYGEDTSADHDIKLTTYFTEMGQPEGYDGDDFPIIAINGGAANYNNEINAYIRTLTNTTDSYTAGVDGKYSIALYPCQCKDGVYQKVDGTTGLQLNSKNYVMVDSAADSVAGNNQITMIDISFLDPTDKNKVAYHLYVPVLTKKMLKFDFSSSALQGTEYEPSDYVDKFPEEWEKTSKLAAGFDSWQTIYAQFDYSKSEMDTFLATGKGLNWNTSKTLYFNYNGNKSLANSTQFVLLDNNNNVDKEYYITKLDISTETNSAGNKFDVIKFGDFTTERNGAAIIDPADKFEPQTLNEIAGRKLRYAANNSGAYVECDESEATVYVYTDPTNAASTDKKFFKAWVSGSEQRYTITVNDTITETYYISMYSFDKDNVDNDNSTTHDAYGLTVTCPLTFTSDVITCQRSRAKNTELFLGNFLNQTLTITNVNENVKISTENHILRATLSSTVGFTGRSANYFHKNLAGEKLYQGFFLYLNRYDAKGEITSDCTIKGQPNYSYTRSINGEIFGSTQSGGLDENAPYLYVLPVEIVVPAYAEGTSWSSSQSATVNIDFGTNEVKLNKEFPTRNKATNDYKGIEINSTVKLDFLRDRVIYSNNKKDPLPEDKPTERYYIDRTTSNGILTLTAFDQAENDEYDIYGEQSHNKSALGINGNYIGTGSKYSTMGDFEHIEVGMDYDVSALPAEIFDGKHTLNFKIVLEQKVDDQNETTGYKYIPVNIEDFTDDEEELIKGYLSGFALYGKSAETALTLESDEDTSYLSYTYSMPMSIDKSLWTLKYTETETQKHITGNIEFNAKTNGELEAIDGYLYTNYRLKVTASISGTSYTSTDWIVYTNAKMNAQYVKKAS